MAERVGWQEFDPSTFTHIGRVTPFVDALLQHREAHGLPDVKDVIVLGSGLVQPFEVAADPRLRGANIYAVEINQDILAMSESIQQGGAVAWGDVARVSMNPGRPNSDFLEKQRIRKSLGVLEFTGALSNLGNGFNDEQMQVAQQVRDRVQFINKDALSALRDTGMVRAGLIVDGWLQLNINKNPDPSRGAGYTQAMVELSIDMLDEDGFYVIGDTGKNLPITYGHFARLTNGQLNMVGFVHAVNFGRGFATSHVLLASKLPYFPGLDKKLESVQTALERNKRLQILEPREAEASPSKLQLDTVKHLNVAYLNDGNSPVGTAWNSVLGLDEALQQLVSVPADEFSTRIVFPPQKPWLVKES